MRASHIPTFLEIVERIYANHDQLKAKLLLDRSETEFEYWGAFAEQQDELDKIYMQVIVFLAMYMEAFIWNIGAIHLGEKTMERLDKLSPQDKWLIVPQMIVGKSFNVKEHHQGYLKSLFQERNRLVHHKSIDITPYIKKDAVFDKIPADLIDLWERIDLGNYFEIIRHLPATLEAAVKEKYN
jgi:hypothetical protein